MVCFATGHGEKSIEAGGAGGLAALKDRPRQEQLRGRGARRGRGAHGDGDEEAGAAPPEPAPEVDLDRCRVLVLAGPSRAGAGRATWPRYRGVRREGRQRADRASAPCRTRAISGTSTSGSAPCFRGGGSSSGRTSCSSSTSKPASTQGFGETFSPIVEAAPDHRRAHQGGRSGARPGAHGGELARAHGERAGGPGAPARDERPGPSGWSISSAGPGTRPSRSRATADHQGPLTVAFAVGAAEARGVQRRARAARGGGGLPRRALRRELAEPRARADGACSSRARSRGSPPSPPMLDIPDKPAFTARPPDQRGLARARSSLRHRVTCRSPAALLGLAVHLAAARLRAPPRRQGGPGAPARARRAVPTAERRRIAVTAPAPHATTLLLVALAAAAAVALFVARPGRGVHRRGRAAARSTCSRRGGPDEITELTVTMASPGAPQAARLTRGEVDDAGQRPGTSRSTGRRTPADEPTVDQLLGTLEFATADGASPRRRATRRARPGLAQALDRPRDGPAPRAPAARRRRPTPPGRSTPRSPAEASRRHEAARLGPRCAAGSLPLAELVLPSPRELCGPHARRRRLIAAVLARPWGGGRAGFCFAEGSPEGSGVRVSAPALDLVLSALGRMQADAFLSEEEARQAAASGGPRVTLTLEPSDPAAKRGVIDVGGACPIGGGPARARRRGAARAHARAACVPASVLDPLTEEAPRFVDLALVAAPLDEVAEVKLRRRRAPGWSSRAPAASGHLRAPQDRFCPYGDGPRPGPGDPRRPRHAPRPGRAISRRSASPRLGLPSASSRRRRARQARASRRSGSRRSRSAPSRPVVVHVRRIEDGAIAEIPALAAGALLPSEVSLRLHEGVRFHARSGQRAADRAPRPGSAAPPDGARAPGGSIEPSGEGPEATASWPTARRAARRPPGGALDRRRTPTGATASARPGSRSRPSSTPRGSPALEAPARRARPG